MRKTLILSALLGAEVWIGGNPVLSIPVRVTSWVDGTTWCGKIRQLICYQTSEKEPVHITSAHILLARI